jgi:hypothetical protein
MPAVLDLLSLVGESFESVASNAVEPLVSNVLLRAGFHSGSVVAAQAVSGTKELLKALKKDPASAKDKIDELMAQSKSILEGAGMGLMDLMEKLPKLLQLTGIDAAQAKLAVLQPALERVWTVVGLGQQTPMLRQVEKILQALALKLTKAQEQSPSKSLPAKLTTETEEDVAAKFTEVRSSSSEPRQCRSC